MKAFLLVSGLITFSLGGLVGGTIESCKTDEYRARLDVSRANNAPLVEAGETCLKLVETAKKDLTTCADTVNKMADIVNMQIDIVWGMPLAQIMGLRDTPKPDYLTKLSYE